MNRPSGCLALRWAAGLLLLLPASSPALSSTAGPLTGAEPSLTALSLTGVPASAAASASPTGPEEPGLRTDLATLAHERLERHIDADALSAWRETCTPAEAQAFDFLLAWLPTSDLAAWRSDRLIADIQLALATREAAPWRGLVDEEAFLRFVLPHRVAQEPIEPWRPTLHALLWPRVRDLSLPDAILETNRFCREWATFQPSSARDQAPSATMKRGLGRCEEEMIFFVCAARSVGIPARPCYTPWWTASDDNHAWVEAWAGDGWHYLGACEPEAKLDRAWFTGPAQRAGLVLSVAYGEEIPGFGASATKVYSRGRGVTLVNSTGVYARAGRATVHWADLDPAAPTAPSSKGVPPSGAEPLAGIADTLALRRARVPVTIHVFNSGSLVPLGTFAAGDTITLGPQDYFASASVDGQPVGAFLTVLPNETALISLDPRGGEEAWRAIFARPFTLRIPEPAEVTASPVAERSPTPEPTPMTRVSQPVSPEAGGAVSLTVAPDTVALPDLAALAREAAQARVASTRSDSLRRVVLSAAWRERDRRGADAVLDHLAKVPPRAAHWLAFLLSATPREAADARALVLEMDDKDFLEADSAAAMTTIREAHRVRSTRAASQARSERAVPDSTWYSFVLSPRIGDQPFDPGLWTTLPLLTGRRGRLSEAPAILAAFAARVRREESKRLGHLARPSETWASGWATPVAARVGLVGLLRRNGIPARVEAEGRWVEAWSGGRWVPCDPFDAASWDRREGDVASATGTPGHLRAVIRDSGRVMTEAEPWRHFRLVRFTDGRFSPLDAEYPVIAGELCMDLEPGSWWLMGGLRGVDGAPRVRAIPFTLAAGESVSVDLNLGTAAEPTRESRLPAALRERVGSGPVLLFAWKTGAEPSIRTATALVSVLSETSTRGVKIVSMPLELAGANAPAFDPQGSSPDDSDPPDSASPGSDSSESGEPGSERRSADPPGPGFPNGVPVRPVSPADLAPLFDIGADTELPVLLLADRAGSVLLRLTGMRPDAADRVREALGRLDASGLARPE